MQIDWDSHTLNVLEFPLVRAMWAERTDTPIGFERAMERPLSAEPELVQVRQQETTEAVQLLLKEPPPGMSGCQEVRPLISKAMKGGVLTPVEFRMLYDALHTVRSNKEFLQPREEHYPRLAHHAQQLYAYKLLEQDIEICIAPGGEVLDEASETLARIRTEQRKLQKRIAEQLQSMLSSHRWREILQEPIYTMRSGRYCLPVRSEYKGRVKGIVHDSSMSGATVYIEPEELVQMGNRTRELESHEQEEIEGILYGLSRSVEAVGESLTHSVMVLGELDAIIAAGRLSLDMEACEPEIMHAIPC
jgi:DNA mismatch repair protein MutS2